MAAKYDGIIFDLDGTLWNATEQIMNAWNVILDKHPEISRGKLEFSELRQCMGLVMYDIAAKLFPDETEDKRNSLMDEMCSYENEYLSIHGGTLYPGLEDTLKELMKIRGGDNGSLNAMNKMLYTQGSASQDQVNQYQTGVTSTKTLKMYFLGMHIRSLEKYS